MNNFLFFSLLFVPLAWTLDPVGGYCGILGRNGPSQAWRIPDPAPGFILKRAVASIRPGDRVTTSYAFPCWDNDDANWNCTVRFLERPHPIVDSGLGGGVGRLYQKQYLRGRNYFGGNCAQGELTRLGYNQHLANGAEFRDYFVNRTGLLPASVHPLRDELVRVRGDDEPRVVQSGMALMLGFFPVSDYSKYTEIWDFETMDRELDDMDPNPNICPRAQQYLDQWVKSPAYVQHFQSVTLPLMKRVAKAIGRDDAWANSYSVVSFFDCLNSHICHGFDVPSGITQELYEEVVAEATWNWNSMFTFPTQSESALVGIGKLLGSIRDQLVGAPGFETQRFGLLSGHDDTLIPLLLALNVWDQYGNKTWVPYASYLLFEQFSAPDGNTYARVVFNGQIMNIPNCPTSFSGYCAFDFFIEQVLSPLIPNQQDCDRSDKRNHILVRDRRGNRHRTPQSWF